MELKSNTFLITLGVSLNECGDRASAVPDNSIHFEVTMPNQRLLRGRSIIAVILSLGLLSACAYGAENNPSQKFRAFNGSNDSQSSPTYSNNGAYDDNGAEPSPNNGNQNFGQRR